MHTFLSAFDDVPDPRAENARHELGELLVIAFVSVLCRATSCAEMSAFGRAKEKYFQGLPEPQARHPVTRYLLDGTRDYRPQGARCRFRAGAGRRSRLGSREGDVVAVDGKALRGARDKGESARTQMMVSAYASRLRLTLASVTTDC